MPSTRIATLTARATVVSLLLFLAATTGAGPAAADHTDSWGVTQGDRCYTVSPLGDGSQTVSEFYDYRAVFQYEYSSYGTTDIQRSQVSQLLVYDGTEGVSLVVLHDRLDDGENTGGVASFELTGLPASGEWVVEDDAYGERDDIFDHGRTSSSIDWFWGANRTDGAAFRGLATHDYDSITIEPGFNENADYWDSAWRWSTNRTESWLLRTGDGETTELVMDQPVSIQRGGCPGAPPTAALSAPAETAVGTTVTLDATASTDDRTIARYEWDTDGDGSVEQTTPNGTLTATYNSVGTVTPAVTVVDAAGNTNTTTAALTVTDTTAPTARLSAPTETVAGSEITVSAENSTDNGAIERYEWSFGDNTTATGATAAHTYDTSGTSTLAVTVTDTAGNTDTARVDIRIRTPDTTAPSAVLAVPGPAEVGTGATLDASASTDNREITRYEWDPDGDGDVEQTTTGGNETLSWTYDDRESVTPAVTVRDAAGNENTTTATFNVTDTTPPTVNLTAPDTALVGESVTVSAGNSTDNGAIESYAWRFGDNVTAFGASVSRDFETNRTYTVALTVTDAAGNNATERTTLTVRRPDTTPPAARLSLPDVAVANQSLSLSAAGSTDDREIAAYEWRLGDGTSATGAEVSHTYDANGTYAVSVTVTDAAGNTDTANATLSVAPPDTTPPTAAVSADSTTAETGESVTFDASGSADDRTVAAYEWTLDDGASATGRQTTRAFDSAGTYEVRLTVRDRAGNSDTATVTVTVEEPSSGGSNRGSVGGGSAPPVNPAPPIDDGPAEPPEEPTRPPMSTTVTTTGAASVLVETAHARAGESVAVAFTGEGPALGAVVLERFTYRVRSNQSRLAVPMSLDTAQVAGPNGTWTRPHNVTVLRSGDQSETAVVRDTTVQFSVRGPTDDRPQDVDFLRRVDGDWRSFEPQVLGSTGNRTTYAISGARVVPVAVDVQRPSVRLDGLSVSGDDPTTADRVRAVATLANGGELAGQRTLTLTADGEQVDTRTVAVPPGENVSVSFTHQFGTAGTHTLGVGDSQQTVSVRQARATLSLRALRADPATVDPGDAVTLTATVANTGDAAGTYAANLTLFGERVGSRSVTVPPGETRELSFRQTISSAGEYVATVGDRTVNVTVRGEEQTVSRPESAGASGPGFGVVAAVLALLVTVAVRWRR